MKYKTFRGKWIDMEDLRQRHAKTVAAGNMDVNAKGDKLGPGGEIIESAQKRTRRHYTTQQTATKTNVSIKGDQESGEDVFTDDKKETAPAPADKKPARKKAPRKAKKKVVEKETESGDIIVEDAKDED